MKKVKKNTSPLRYDLNQILYDYTGEVMNRFKGLDLVVSEEPWTEVCIILQEEATESIPKEKNARRQNGCLRRPYK